MTPEQEERVRRALADAARDRTPIPPEVAGRMDDVLADLVAARAREASTQPAAPHDDLAARRHRRWPAVLAAAAVVCLVALGGPAVLRSLTSAGNGSASQSAPAPVADAGGSSGEDTAPEAATPGSGRALADGVLPAPRLHRATLQRDLRRVLAVVPLSAPSPDADTKGLTGGREGTEECALPSPTRGDDTLAVLLDGKPATLVLAAPRDGTREATVYACDDASAPVATTRVRVR
jgi:hypothetical protein